MIDEKNAIKIFQDRKIRSVWHAEEEQWYFSIVDVIAVLMESLNLNNYWKVLKSRLIKEGNQSVTTCNQLKMASPKGGTDFRFSASDYVVIYVNLKYSNNLMKMVIKLLKMIIYIFYNHKIGFFMMFSISYGDDISIDVSTILNQQVYVKISLM